MAESAAQEAPAAGLSGEHLAEREAARSPRVANAVVFVLSFAFALVLWEAVSASGVIREEGATVGGQPRR